MAAEKPEHNLSEQEVLIRNPHGLHMRPAMQFVECANKFQSAISVSKGTQRVDGKSIMEMMLLVATHGTKLRIAAQGHDAAEAVAALAPILEEKGT